MTSRWQDVGCASIPVQDLRVLAGLRRRPGIRVSIVGDRAWVCWELETEPVQQVLVECLLPLPGVEIFTRRGGYWYRPGEHLPAFGVPVGAGSEGVPLERIVLPRPMTALRPVDDPPNPILLRLARDQRSQPRAASALRCPLDRLTAWSEQATSARLASLLGVWTAGPGDEPAAAEVLVLGVPTALPELWGGLRFWGVHFLVPLGFRADPELPERALCHAVGAGPNDLIVLDGEGYELIPRDAFQPLSRAGIRLAREGKMSGRPGGGRQP